MDANIHFHIYDNNAHEITLATLYDGPRHFEGMIREACLPEVAGTTVTRSVGDFGEDVVVVDHPETETFHFVKAACGQALCWEVQKDYWL